MYDEFKNITGFDIEDYFNRFVSFVTDKSQNIINYYSGLVPNMDRDSYTEFINLVDESSFVLNLFDLNLERFNTVDYWELIDFCDDIKIKLETIGNFNKFSRSSVNKESFSQDVIVQVSKRENETLEELMDRIGSTNRDEDWAEIAISNALIQEDYTDKGELVLNVNFKNNSKFFINSVVDNPEGEKIKGKDVSSAFIFEDDDLKVLGYDDTLQQSVDIMLNLKKNDNPEFPQMGIDKTLVAGMTFKSIATPSIIRQLFQVFSTDDLIEKIEVTSSEFGQDYFNMNLNINVKSGEQQMKILSIGN